MRLWQPLFISIDTSLHQFKALMILLVDLESSLRSPINLNFPPNTTSILPQLPRLSCHAMYTMLHITLKPTTYFPVVQSKRKATPTPTSLKLI